MRRTETISALLSGFAVVATVLISAGVTSLPEYDDRLVWLAATTLIAAGVGAVMRLLMSRGEKLRREPGRVFLSYLREDREQAKQLYDTLRQAGFKPWMDDQDLLPGERWEPVIMRAIEASDIVLVLISRHTQLETGFLHKEIGIALERLIDLPSGVKPVIPVRLEEAGIPTSLAGIHAVDMFMPDGPKRLMDTLHRAIET